MGQIKRGSQANEPGFKAAWKLLTSGRFGE